MAKNKNALRKHFIGPYSAEHPETAPEKEAYMWIAKGIKSSAPENNEEDDEGHRDYSDKAQNFVVDKEDEVGDDLIVWYKEISSDGKTQKEGLARLSEIEIGDGEASELEKIKFKIVWTRKPKKSNVLPE